MAVRIPTITDLDKEQREVVRFTPYDAPMFVKGPPGSGKTHIAILRLNVLISEGYTNILFLLYNHSMYGFLKHVFRKMGLVNTIDIHTKDKYFYDVAKRRGYNVYGESQFEKYEIKYAQRLSFLERCQTLPKYDLIVIDECQDFMLSELNLLNKMTSNIIAVGDNEQSVYRTDGISFFQRLPARELKNIYRYGRQVAAVAQYFSVQRVDILSKVTNTNKSDVYKVITTSRMQALVSVKKIVEAKRTTSMTIGIFSLTNKQLQELDGDLQRIGVHSFYCKNNNDMRDYDFDQRVPVLITPFSAKGMEFDCVILFGYSQQLLDSVFSNKWKEVIYVSLTRTCSELYLIQESDTMRQLSDLQEWKPLSSAESNRQIYDF